MPRFAKTSQQRIQESRAALPSKKEAEAALVLANAPAAVREVVVKTSEQKSKTEKAAEKTQTAYEKFLAKTKQAWDDGTRVDVLGGLGGQVWNEAANLGFRALGEWSEKTAGEDGFWASNVDLTQSLAGAIGTFLYILEKGLRPEFDPEDARLPAEQRRPYIPSGWRLYLSEASKIAGHLGFSNTVRALRFRWVESIDERNEKKQQNTELQTLLKKATDELSAVKAQLRQLQSQSKAAANTADGEDR